MEWAASAKRVNGMAILEMMLASLILLFPAWLIWRAFSTSRQLELRLAQGDASLLSDDRFSIDRVTLGPQGTQLIEDVQFVAVQTPVPSIPTETSEVQSLQGE
tara:strand:- start:94 stop:402 length:309 start_codon:yes stop_codon:yes gene_type:complete